jgi:DGQHR domain-containing protein
MVSATFEYPAICFQQRPTANIWFCLISVPVGQLLQWARVDRLEPDNIKGVQRKKNDFRTRRIANFLQVDEVNTIPTTLTIALPLENTNLTRENLTQLPVAPQSMTLTVSVDAGDLPGLIIDGQHRVFGINEFDPATLVSVVVVLGADDAEIAFQFLVINNKVSKVSPDHIRALRLAYREDQLDARLTKSARMRSTGAPTYLETIDIEPESPFKGRLKWPRNPDNGPFNLIPPNAFETALLYISNQQLSSGADSEVKSHDYVVELFLEIWKKVKETWSSAWSEPSSRLLSKLGVVCMSQYLVDTLIARAEASDDIEVTKDLGQVRDIIGHILQRQSYDFWMAPWNAASLDTSAGRDIVVKDLRKIAVNKRAGSAWDSGLRLIDTLD